MKRNKDGSRVNPLAKNGSRSKTKSGQTYVVFCTTCLPENVGDPQKNVHVTVDGTFTPRFVTCKNGHRTRVHR